MLEFLIAARRTLRIFTVGKEELREIREALS